MKKIIILFLLGICVHAMPLQAQSYTFTNQSKAVTVGSYTNNGSYTISFNLQTDTGFHRSPEGVLLFNYGDNRVYIKYPSIYFVTTYVGKKPDGSIGTVEDFSEYQLSQFWGYSKINDHRQHRITFRRNQSIKEFLCDSVLMGTDSCTVQSGFTAALWLGSGDKRLPLSATMSNVIFTPAFLKYPVEVKMPVGVIDSIEYPLGYKVGSGDWKNVDDAPTQLSKYKVPVFHKNSIIKRNSLLTELKYEAGYNPDKQNDYNKISRDGIAIQTALLKFNCAIRICSNLNSWYSDYTRRNYCFDCAMWDVAKANPAVRKDFGTSIAHCDNIPPYYANEPDLMDNSTPVAYLTANRNIRYLQGALLKSTLISNGISVDSMLTLENNEGFKTNTANYVRNMNYFNDSMYNLFPKLTHFCYDVYGYNAATSWPEILGMNNTNTGNLSMYMQYPTVWNTNFGQIRGVRFDEFTKPVEIASGHPINTIACSAGWNAVTEINIQPSQYSGLLGILQVLGTEYFLPAYFTINGTGIQDPKSYCWQAAMPSYVQAAVSDPEIWDIIMTGTLVQEPGALSWDYNLWSQDIEVKTVCKKKGTKYVIATTHQKLNNFKQEYPRRVSIAPVVEGVKLDMLFARYQFTGYIYDSSKPLTRDPNAPGANPRHFTKGISVGHPSRHATSLILNSKDN